MNTDSSPPSLDTLREREGLVASNKRTWAKRIFRGTGFLFAILLVGGAFFTYRILAAGTQVFAGDENNGLLADLQQLIGSHDGPIEGEEDGRTNILLLGMGGEGHSGQYLTDTMMVISIEHAPSGSPADRPPQVSMISLPRDMWVPIESQGYEQKLNHVYWYGEREDDDGMGRLRPVIEHVLGIPIHYYVRADFEGFEKVVDDLGGIEVDVERGFVDSEYPTEDYGYQTIQFDAGVQEMNGDAALKYARSRHGTVTEGEGHEASDFARSRRQQLILAAVREKALSANTILNPNKLTNISTDLGDHVRTDLEPWEMLRMVELARIVDQEKIINKVLDNGQNGLLYATNHPDGGYSLIPNIPDFSEIQIFAQNIFMVPVISEEGARIAVLNGTLVTGLATSTTGQLEEEEYTVAHFGNAVDQKTQHKTVIYPYNREHPETIRLLRDRFQANVSTVIPDRETLTRPNDSPIPEDTDLVVILGKDYAQDHQPIY